MTPEERYGLLSDAAGRLLAGKARVLIGQITLLYGGDPPLAVISSAARGPGGLRVVEWLADLAYPGGAPLAEGAVVSFFDLGRDVTMNGRAFGSAVVLGEAPGEVGGVNIREALAELVEGAAHAELGGSAKKGWRRIVRDFFGSR